MCSKSQKLVRRKSALVRPLVSGVRWGVAMIQNSPYLVKFKRDVNGAWHQAEGCAVELTKTAVTHGCGGELLSIPRATGSLGFSSTHICGKCDAFVTHC